MKAHSKSGKRREIKGQVLGRMWTERRLPTEVVAGGSAVGWQWGCEARARILVQNQGKECENEMSEEPRRRPGKERDTMAGGERGVK